MYELQFFLFEILIYKSNTGNVQAIVVNFSSLSISRLYSIRKLKSGYSAAAL